MAQRKKSKAKKGKIGRPRLAVPRVVLVARLHPDTAARVRQEAVEQGRTVSGVVEMALRRYLDMGRMRDSE